MAITMQNTGASLVRAALKGQGHMKIKLRSGTIIDGKHANAGTVVDVGKVLGRQLIHAGRAVPASEENPKPMTREPEKVSKPKSGGKQ